MEHRAAIAQACHAFAIEQVGIDTGHLLGGIGAQTQRTSGQLVDQLERLQVQGFAGTRQQGLQVLQEGRHDQLIPIATRRIEQSSTQFFDVPCLGGQYIGDVIRQDPSRHGKMGGC
ncbi:hypothetical protein D3C78_1289440 [compost metagenome]